MTFFESLNFSSANEDGTSELEALCASPPRRLVCLTGSGARVLDMLLGDPGEVIALDINPVQNELLHLKIAALQSLDDRDLYIFLGLAGSRHERAALRGRVMTALPPASKVFWDSRASLIVNGIWYMGRWERVLRFGARGTRLLRGGHIERLFAAATLGEQADIWARHFDGPLWRASIRLLGRRWFWTKIIGEPGGAFLPAPHEIERRLAGAFNHAAETFFFRHSDFASLILRGSHEIPHALPLHLQPQNLPRVRQRLNRVRVVQGGLHELASLDIRDADAFSLSDFGSYCTQSAYEACWRGIMSAAAAHARVCEREFMNALPDSPLVVWDAPLSQALTAKDKSFIYKVRAGTISTGAPA